MEKSRIVKEKSEKGLIAGGIVAHGLLFGRSSYNRRESGVRLPRLVFAWSFMSK